MEEKRLEMVVREDGLFVVKDYDKLYQTIVNYVAPFKDLVVDKDNEKDIKKARTEIRKISKTITDERIAIEKEYMKPFNVGKSQIKALTDLLDETDNHLKDGLNNLKEPVIETEYVIGYQFNNMTASKQVEVEKLFNKLGLDFKVL